MVLAGTKTNCVACGLYGSSIQYICNPRQWLLIHSGGKFLGVENAWCWIIKSIPRIDVDQALLLLLAVGGHI